MAPRKTTPKSEDLNKIIASAAEIEKPSPTPDLNLPDLSLELEDHKLEFQLTCLREDLKQLQDTHGLRLDYTGHIFKLVCTWLACVVACVILSGFGRWGFRLSDSVLIAFITSTTVNVVGLFVLVAKWMFPTGSGRANGHELNVKAESLVRRRPRDRTQQGTQV
jgi:hypothetical protein